MDIRFRCNNISEFDPATGNYVYCQQLLSAESQHVGLKVRCPRCKQTATVPHVEMASVAAGNGRQAPSGASVESADLADTDLQATEPQLEYSRFDKKVRCPRCGSLLDEEKRCTACRYAMPIVKPSQIPLEKMDVKPAGFQLWILQIMSDGISPRALGLTCHLLFSIVVIICVLAAIGLGGANFAIVLGFLGLLSGFYILTAVKINQLATRPAMRLPFYLQPFWNLLLVLARSMDWQKYDSMLKDRKIIDVRGEDFGDRELLALEDLHVCEVLDAEGTDITDYALAAMHGLKHLRCLVLRGTHVTDEAVFRLQQALPRCWIWY